MFDILEGSRQPDKAVSSRDYRLGSPSKARGVSKDDGADDRQASCGNDMIQKEAASILIQLVAPRDSIYHFLKLAHENHWMAQMELRENLYHVKLDQQLSSACKQEETKQLNAEEPHESESSDEDLQDMFDESSSFESDQTDE